MKISTLASALLISLGLATASDAAEFARSPLRVVPNNYLVVLDDVAIGLTLGAEPEDRARAFEGLATDLRRVHGVRRSTLLNHLGILVVEADERTARRLARDPRVLLVEEDAVGGISLFQQCYAVDPYTGLPVPKPLANSYLPSSPQAIGCWDPQISCSDNWGLDRIGQRQGDVWAHTTDFSYAFSATGAGVHIYLADTGIAWDHQEFLGSGGVARVGNGTSWVPQEPGTYDSFGHGTHVAGIAAGRRFGVAKQATVHSVRVCDRKGSCQQSWVIGGLDWIAANAQRPAIVNMSFNLPRWREDTSTLELAASRFIAWYGIAIVNSAGNWNQSASNFAPTSVPEVIVAGGIDWVRNERWGAHYSQGCHTVGCGSNYGPSVDVFAPATDVRSASMDPLRACRLTGTSMAAPHVTGVAALYLQLHPSATPAELQSMLISTATVGVIPAANLGPGTPNRLLFTDY